MIDKRILVVDDDDAIRALLVTILKRRAITVDSARHGAEALERLKNCRYALMLLDLMMPHMNGYELLDEIATMPQAERPIVIVLTAGSEPRNLSPDIVAGSVRKPFDIELLCDTIAACLATAAAAEQRKDCPPPDNGRTLSQNEPN